MMNKLALLVLATLLAKPALADKIKLSDYKTVAVQPVMAAGDGRGLFEMELAASASQLTIKPDRAAAAKKASTAYLDGKDSGFGFAGKAQGIDVALLLIGTAVGMLPTVMKMDAAKAKEQATQYAGVLTKIEGKVDANVTKALSLAIQGAQTGDFEITTKALLVAMALSAESIKKGSERPHGYMATGIYVGLSVLFASSGQGNQTLADMGAPLVMYLEQDAALGGADRIVASQLKIVAGELAKSSPDLQKILGASETMNSVKPD